MNQNVIASYALISQLKKLGVKRAVVSPGSRNTPLAYSTNELLETLVIIDERDAGFCALGIAEATNTPVVVITTSGSAPTHLFPSVSESSGSNIPLIVISADRPHELRGRGAPQTIDQIELFTTHVRYFNDSPLPKEDIKIDFWINLASDIFNASVGSFEKSTCAGPVHLNIGFNEDLVPDGDEIIFVENYLENLGETHTKQNFGFSSSNYETMSMQKDKDFELSQEIKTLVKDSKNILCTIGRNGILFQERKTVLKYLKDIPVLCDATSQMRFSEDVITTYDTIVRKQEIQSLKPDLIVQIGDCLTSKKFNEFAAGIETIAIKPQSDGRNPYGNITHTIVSPDINAGIESILEIKTQVNNDFLKSWKLKDENANTVLLEVLDNNQLSEPSLMFSLGNLIGNESSKFDVLLGSSMPVRNAEWFWRIVGSQNRVFSHRGTNGIDGFIASVFGIAMGGSNRAIGVCGDVTFAHDLGFLPHCVNLSKKYKKDITIFVIDNDGGAIFTHLNQNKSQVLSQSYEKLIATPPQIDLKEISLSCGASYFEIDLETLDKDLKTVFEMENVGTTIVRIQVNHESGLDFMNQLNSIIE